MIVLLLFLAISSTAQVAKTYINFSSTSNPTRAAVSLQTDISFFSSNSQDYTVEFWMRPTWNNKTVAQTEVIKDSAD